MTHLLGHSIEVILASQAPTGAYLASPNFPAYRYSWFRDSAFIAYAMDLVGQHESAQRFHYWAARTILRHGDKAERAIKKARQGEPLGEDYLHTRYTLNGDKGPDDWPNFQLDGLGTWLWALAEHLRCTSEPMSPEGEMAVDLVARYLAALWFLPCYDLWEEYPQYLHPYTLAAIYAGLQAAERLTTADHRPRAADGLPLSDVTDQIHRFVLERGVRKRHLVKHINPPGGRRAREQESKGAGEHGNGGIGDFSSAPQHSSTSTQIDASLIGAATPYRLFPSHDPIMQATVTRVEAELHCPGGGVHRYLADTYYGGGEWVLLAAWLGWYYAEVGETTRAGDLLRWVEAQADANGHLPEQVSTHLLAPDHYAEWEVRWGPVANPLLWSHAMYLILYRALEATEQG